MKNKTLFAMLIIALSLIVCISTNSHAAPMGTAFTYQGRFIDSGSPADGVYDFEFDLYDVSTGGTPLGSTITKGNLQVTDGYFTTDLDFGTGKFDGDARWLEIGVRPGDSTGAYTTLSPRQELTPTPYTLHADSIIYESAGGNVGIGTTSPSGLLELQSTTSTYLDLDTGSGYNSEIRFLEAGTTQGYIWHKSSGDYIGIGGGTATNSVHVKTATGNFGIGTASPAGKLDVNGSIYQRGGLLHADYVFEPYYVLESIEEHSQFMWQHKHLEAIPKAKVDDNGQEIIELGAHNRGIVEELEKAHIYIEQLNKRIKVLEEKLAKLEADGLKAKDCK